MRVLQVNKYHHVMGGAERYYFELSKLLKDKGHSVAHFSMDDKNNLDSKWNKYFVSNVSFEPENLFDSLGMLARMVYSVEARSKFAELLDDFKPDVVHLHNINYHLSPSFLPEIKKRGVPIVLTLHDYHLLTPNINFFHDGKICEITKRKNYFRAVFHRCVKGSYFASFAAAAAMHIHDLFGLYDKYIDLYLAPSMFIKNKLVEHEYCDPKKIVCLAHFLDGSKYSAGKANLRHEGGYVLYFGRLTEEKGLSLLIEVAGKLPEVKFKIVGKGEQKYPLKKLSRKLKVSNVEFIGYKKGQDLEKIVRKCLFVVMPSLWYENAPYSILEAFAAGKPVVASNIGGIPELVEKGKSGLLFEAGSLGDFSNRASYLWNRPSLVRKMGSYARKTVEEKCNPLGHYDKLMEVYARAKSC